MKCWLYISRSLIVFVPVFSKSVDVPYFIWTDDSCEVTIRIEALSEEIVSTSMLLNIKDVGSTGLVVGVGDGVDVGGFGVADGPGVGVDVTPNVGVIVGIGVSVGVGVGVCVTVGVGVGGGLYR